ncbi:MAG: TldD/PmbA family protein [Vulcanimicrobiaceae bacterium]
MDSAAREALAGRVLTLAGDVPTEAIVWSQELALTRFTRNAIHQNLAQADTVVRIRRLVDGRSGVAQTNGLGDDDLRAALERAGELASLAPPDPDAIPLAHHPRPPDQPSAYVPATAVASPQFRAAAAATIFEVAERADLWAAGYVQTAAHGLTVANSAGTCASFDASDGAINVKANGPDASGFAEQIVGDVGKLDAAAVASVAAEKAAHGAHPRAVEPGAWTVILEPAAFGELLVYLADHFSARAYDEGSSFLCGRLGERCASEAFTLRDDVAEPRHPGAPFDFEGYPTQRTSLIERGIAAQVVTDERYARKLGLPNTGHGLPAPNAYGPQARHLVVEPGRRPFTELIAQTERGLLVSRFWYIRPVDQRKTIVTGMTRDGTFLIENGRLVGGVHNLRFNQSIIEALERSEFSNDLRRTGGYSYDCVVPAARIEGFSFTSATDF